MQTEVQARAARGDRELLARAERAEAAQAEFVEATRVANEERDRLKLQLAATVEAAYGDANRKSSNSFLSALSGSLETLKTKAGEFLERIVSLAIVGVIVWFVGAEILADKVELDAPAIDAGAPCEACPEMVELPAGKFVMGSALDEEERY